MASSFAPRQEANSLDWTSLSQDQRTLVEKVHLWLTELGRSPSAPHRDKSFVPNLDEVRASRVLLIDGPRGAGKTTLMLSLLRMWTQALAGFPTPKNVPSVVSGLLSKKQVIPVDIVDMQPMAGYPSLLLQLAGRMYRVTELLMSRSSAKYEEDHCCQLPASLEAWRQLAQAIAVGGEDDPRQRRSSSNPEDFAIELEQAERKRMTISEQWRKFVDELLADVGNPKYAHLLAPYLPGIDPVFVVPIDDADMNPERGVKLLELLRSLWHPRVVFLLTGDAGLFRTLLFNHYKKDCERMPDIMARNLAHDVLGKVIPPAQRLRCRVDPKDAVDHLKQWGVLPEELVKRVDDAGLYEAFPRRWRVLIDLKQTKDGTQSTLVDVAKVLFEEAVRGSTLSQTEQDHLLSVIFRPARRGLGLRVDESAVTMQPELDHRGELVLDERRAVSWNVSDGDRWSLRMHSEDTTNAEREALPDSIVHSLYLAASLASEPQSVAEVPDDKSHTSEPQSVAKVPDDKSHTSEPQSVAQVPADKRPRYTRVSRSLSLANYDLIKSIFSFEPIQYEFPWPTPEWVDPMDFYIFQQGWRDALSSKRAALSTFPGTTQVSTSQIAAFESLVSWWISALCSLADGRTIIPEAWQDPGAIRWQGLGGRIAALANPSSSVSHSPQKQAYERWARQDALFFSSKLCGLSVTSRNAILTGWLAKLRPLIAGHSHDEDYWFLVDEATHGQIQFLERASKSVRNSSIEQQIDCAIRNISNPTWKIFIPNDDGSPGEVSVEGFRRAITDKFGDVPPVQQLRYSIQALDPESEGALSDFDMNSNLIQYTRNNDEKSRDRRIQHFEAHLENCLSQINLTKIPYPLNELATQSWKNLWSRAKNIGLNISWDVTTRLAELAESRDLLEQLSNSKSAQEAWKTVIGSYFASKASLKTRPVTQVIDDFLCRSQKSPMAFLLAQSGKTYELTSQLAIMLPELHAVATELASVVQPDQSEATELLIKLHDIVADETDVELPIGDDPIWIDHHSVIYAKSSYMLAFPGWPNSVDLLLYLNGIDSAVSSIASGVNPVAFTGDFDAWTGLCGFLIDSCIAIRLKRTPYRMSDYLNSILARLLTDNRRDEFLMEFYRSLANAVAQANDSRFSGRRARAVREWVNLAGPLCAAPETGMSEQAAMRWLAAWDRSPSNTADPAACKRLSDFRLKRAQVSLGPEATQDDARRFLNAIDEKNKEHPWVRIIESQATETERA